MAGRARLATILDQEMLEIVQGVRIASRVTPDEALPVKPGSVVA